MNTLVVNDGVTPLKVDKDTENVGVGVNVGVIEDAGVVVISKGEVVNISNDDESSGVNISKELGDGTTNDVNIELVEKSGEDSSGDVIGVSVGRDLTLGESDTVNGVTESISDELIKKKMDEDSC